MPTEKPPSSGPRSLLAAGRDLRTFTAFGIVSFANALLPYIIFSGLYLIIPFPQPVVLLIELLPALAVKLLFPHILHYIRCWVWPILHMGCWTLAAFATDAAPPNVTTPIRTLIALLASASAATAEVFFLSRLSHYGKTALAGWGTGTAAAGTLCAILPTVLTSYMGLVLRHATGYVYYLLLATAAAYFVVLPPLTCYRQDDLAADDELSSKVESQNLALLPAESPSVISYWGRFHNNLHLTSRKLLRLCIYPLLLVTAAQVLASSGRSRASAMLPIFQRYSEFSAAYGIVFQLGNLMARSTALLFRAKRPRLIFALLVFFSIVAILDTAFILISNAYFVFTIIFAIGWTSGMMYMNIFSAAMEYLSRNPHTDAEFALGSIGVGETAGILIRSLTGVTFKSQLCGLANRSGRWCSTIT